MFVHICSPQLITHTTLSYKMGVNWVRNILQRWIGYTSVGKHILVVAIYKCGLLTWDSKHPYLIKKSLYIFNSLLRCKKLASKGTCFTLSFILRHPINWSFIQENNESISWSSINWVSVVIAIHIYSHPDSQSSGIRHIMCRLFFDIPINNWIPVFTFEVFWENRRFTWIKYHLSIVMFIWNPNMVRTCSR